MKSENDADGAGKDGAAGRDARISSDPGPVTEPRPRSGDPPAEGKSGVLLLLAPPPAGRDGYGIGEEEEDGAADVLEGAGPREMIISMTLGRTMWLGLRVLQRFRTGPSGSSFTWMSGFTGTGFQEQTGSMVISS